MYKNNKISMRQAMLLFLTCAFSPSVRLLPNYGALHANQAAWLSPIVAFIAMLPVVYTLHAFFKKYPEASLSEINDIICGKVIGKIVTCSYLLLIILLTSLYVRYYAERLLSTILPNVNIYVFLIPMLLTVAIALRKGIVVVARMNEIIVAIIVIFFAAAVVSAIPSIEPDYLVPVSRLDILPVARASVSIIGIWSYMGFLFFFGDVINNKPDIKKSALKTLAFSLISTILLIGVTIGLLGAPLVRVIPIPFFAAVRQISLFNVIERIESLIVSTWLFSDFIIIAVFMHIALCIFKYLFKLEETKPIVGIYSVAMLFLAVFLTQSMFELYDLSEKILITANVIWGVPIPLALLAIGKIRKKI